jgi:hypothetical protein
MALAENTDSKERQMTNATDAQPSNTDITDHFSSWGGHHTLRDGFVDWAWDARSETLAALQGLDEDGLNQLVDDIAYSLRQSDQFRTADQADVDRASRDFLEHHRDELIEALRDSLNDR